MIVRLGNSYIYKSIRKRKAISGVDQVQSIIDDNAIVADSFHQSCYLVAHKKEVSSQDGPCKKKAIRNEQMVMTPTMGTSKVRNAHSQTECHDEKGIENGVHGRKRSNVLS